jgi:hypothetical protein
MAPSSGQARLNANEPDVFEIGRQSSAECEPRHERVPLDVMMATLGHSLHETTFGGNKVLVAMIIFPLIAGLSCAPGRAARLVVS